MGSENKQIIMDSHYDGETWGLQIVDDDHIITSGDDNSIKVWSIS